MLPKFNPVKSGLKQHGSPRAYFRALKEQVATKSTLTAMEWDWYRARQREWEPEVLLAEMEAAGHRLDLEHARRLSVDDLKMILAEKSS